MECAVSIVLLVFALWFLDNGHRVLKQWLRQRHTLKMEELRVRRIEAFTRMDEPSRTRLLATMPDWLDPSDDEDVEAWKEARGEVINTGRKRRRKTEE